MGRDVHAARVEAAPHGGAGRYAHLVSPSAYGVSAAPGVR